MNYSMAVRDLINEVLKGIDETETASDDGWWETSDGATFGWVKKEELIFKLNEQINEWMKK